MGGSASTEQDRLRSSSAALRCTGDCRPSAGRSALTSGPDIDHRDFDHRTSTDPTEPVTQPVGLNRQILRLAVPALGALLAEPTFLLVDAAIVGHLGTEQLAGVGIASVILGTLVGLSVFLAYGTTAQVARSLGAGQPDRALSFGIAGLYLAVIIGLVLLVIGWPLAPQLIDWFGGGPAESEYGTIFLRWSLIGLPAMLAVLATTGVLRGLQDTRTPLLVAVVGAIVEYRVEPATGQRFSPRRRRVGDRHRDHPNRNGDCADHRGCPGRKTARRTAGTACRPHPGRRPRGHPAVHPHPDAPVGDHRHHRGRRPARCGRTGRAAGGVVHLEFPGAGFGCAGDRRAGTDRQGTWRRKWARCQGIDQGHAALGGVGGRRHRRGGAADPRGRRVAVLARPGRAGGGGRRVDRCCAVAADFRLGVCAGRGADRRRRRGVSGRGGRDHPGGLPPSGGRGCRLGTGRRGRVWSGCGWPFRWSSWVRRAITLGLRYRGDRWLVTGAIQ